MPAGISRDLVHNIKKYLMSRYVKMCITYKRINYLNQLQTQRTSFRTFRMIQLSQFNTFLS